MPTDPNPADRAVEIAEWQWGWLNADRTWTYASPTEAAARLAASRSGARQLMRRHIGPWLPVPEGALLPSVHARLLVGRMTSLRCIICPVFRPAATPRLPDFPPVCGSCRTRLHAELTEIPDLYARLDSAKAGSGTGPKVSGSKEPPVPLSVDVVDLTDQSRPATLTITGPDQIGYLSVATELDFWVGDWRMVLWPDHSLPVPTVAVLAGWLRVRLDKACDEHPAIDEFAAKVHQIHRTLRSALGLTRHIDRLPAPCPTCDTLGLYRESGAAYVECGNCRRLWSEPEYQRLVVVLAAEIEGAA